MTRSPHVLSVALALASGCSLILDAPEATTNRCAADADCSSGACSVELGMCVDEPESPYNFVVAVTMPSDELVGRPGQAAEDGPFVVGGARDTAVTIPPAVPLAGRVRSDALRVDADLVFTRVDPDAFLSSAPIVVSTIAGATLETDDFRTWLVPGQYAVEVRPRGTDAATFPPLHVEVDVDAGRTFDVNLPALGDYTTLEGTVVDASGVPIDGLEVRAIEAETGRRVSSIATTSSRPRVGSGGFALRLAPGAERWLLQVSAPADFQLLAAFPTIVIDPSVLVRDPDGLVRLLVPSADTGRCIAGTVELPGGRGPAIGASVVLRSNDLRDMETGIAGRFTVQMTTRSGTSDDVACTGAPLAAGAFAGRVLPGTYDVEIRPLDDTAAVYVGQVVVGETDHLGQIFELPARTVLGGTVQRSADHVVSDARVRAIALRVPLPYERTRVEALLNRPNDALTDATGRFSLPLDVGVYDLVVEPPVGSNFPWIARASYGIGGSSEGPVETFDVRTPVAVPGTATHPDGTPIANAQVEAFGIITDDEGVERPLPIGRATTEEDGTFLLLLPPSIASSR